MQLNFDRLIMLSIGFFLLFTSFGTAQALAGHVLEEDDFGNVGFYSLSILYCVFGFCCFISLPIVKRLGAKCCLITGALCYTFYVGSFILPSISYTNPSFKVSRTLIVTIILVGAAINGFGAAILWVAQGEYLSKCAND